MLNKNIILFLVLLSLIFSGCKKMLRIEKMPEIKKVLVLDFKNPAYVQTQRQISGWWLGSKDIFESENSGRILSDNLSLYMSKYNYIIIPRVDLRYYILDKIDQIKKDFTSLKDNDINHLISKSDPIDFGNVFNSDFVITGNIIQCKTVHNRAFHYWYSIAEIEIFIYDIHNKNLILTEKYKKKKYFYSTLYTLDFLSQMIADDLSPKISKKE